MLYDHKFVHRHFFLTTKMTTPTPTTDTTITTPPTITQAEEDKRDQKKLAQDETR